MGSYLQNKVQVQATVWLVIPTAANSISIEISLLHVYKQISGNFIRLALTFLCAWTSLRRTESGTKLLKCCYIHRKLFTLNRLTYGNCGTRGYTSNNNKLYLSRITDSNQYHRKFSLTHKR